MRDAQLELNLRALAHNFKRVRELAPNAKVLAMVKAEAYGHGAIVVAKALADADGFGVAFLAEAQALRAAGITKSILILEGVFTQEEFNQAAEIGAKVIVHQPEQLVFIEQYRGAASADIWLKLNSGMNRLGFKPEQAASAFQRILACACVRELGMATHFAQADDVESEQTPTQIATFNAVYAQLQCLTDRPILRSLSNSAGIVSWPEAHHDWVRPGIMLYGSSPFENQPADALNLLPVMTLSSRLIAINSVKKGEPVGYGARWIADRDTRLGIVAIGYGDGYPRHARNGTPVLINGQRFPLVGRVAMDMITVDLGDAHVELGDKATLWGEGLAVDEVAQCAQTISYELLCKVTSRVTRKVKA